MLKSALICSVLLMTAPAAALAQGSDSSAMSMPAPSTPDYIKMAGQSDQFEIQSGQLAAQNGSSAAVKRFGNEMVSDHTKSTQMVMAAAAKSGMTPPSAPPPLSADQQQMLATLQGTTGKDFDRTYVSQQMQAHQKALMLQQAYAAGGSDPNLQKAAGKIVPVVKKHIGMLQDLSSMSNGM